MSTFDVAVIGAGMIGSSAAFALAESARKVALIGPSEPNDKTVHTGTFAGHYDEGRITRVLDIDPLWADWAAKSIARYAEIEERSGIRFHAPSGSIRMAPAGAMSLELARKAVESHELGLEEIDAAEVTRRFPAFCLPDDFTALWEPPPAGHVNPRRMVAALKAVAAQSGAELFPREAVALRENGDGIEITLDDGRAIGCDKVLVAVGPHALDPRLLPVLPDLTPFGRTVVQIEVEPGDADLAGLPSFIVAFEADDTDYGIYGVPPVVYPDGRIRLKTGGGNRIDALDGSDSIRNWFHSGGSNREARAVREKTLRIFPQLETARWRMEPCALVETGTNRPFIGRVPGHEAIGIALGCCGYAAKSCVAVGKTASDMIGSDDWAASPDAAPLTPHWRTGW